MPRPTLITEFGLGLAPKPSYVFERRNGRVRPRTYRKGYTLLSEMPLHEARTYLTGSARGTHADAELIREAAERRTA